MAKFDVLRLRVVSLIFVVWWALAVVGVSAQTEQAAEATKKDEQEDENLDRMRSLAKTIEVNVGTEADNRVAEASEKPLLRFSDPSRAHSDGAVWAWTATGRPVVFAEFRTADYREGIWGHDLVLTSETLATATALGHGKWSPQETDFAMKAIPGARTPEDSEAARLRQMKQLARRFSGSEEWMGERIELRVLPNSIYRYRDPNSGLEDGAVFAFVAGTNPEALLFVEAKKQAAGELIWNCGFARMTAASLSLKLEADEVYSAPLSFGAADAPYYAFTRSVPTTGAVGPVVPSAE